VVYATPFWPQVSFFTIIPVAALSIWKDLADLRPSYVETKGTNETVFSCAVWGAEYERALVKQGSTGSQL